MAPKAGMPADTNGNFCVRSALRTGNISTASDLVTARLGQILTLVLLTLASLPKFTSPDKTFRPDF